MSTGPGNTAGSMADPARAKISDLVLELHAQVLAEAHRAELAVGDDLDLIGLAHLGVGLEGEQARSGDGHFVYSSP